MFCTQTTPIFFLHFHLSRITTTYVVSAFDVLDSIAPASKSFTTMSTSLRSPWLSYQQRQEQSRETNFASASIDDQECKAEDLRLQERIDEALQAPGGRLRLYVNNMRCGKSLTDDVCRIRGLRELYCQDNVRLERLPMSLHHLGATLQVIDASRCNLREVPEGLAQLRCLKHLSLAGNKLRTFVWDCTPFIRYPDSPYPITQIPSSTSQVEEATSRLIPKWKTKQIDPPPLPSLGRGGVSFEPTHQRHGGPNKGGPISRNDDDQSEDSEEGFKFWGLTELNSPIPNRAAHQGSSSTASQTNAPLRDRHRYISMNYASGKLEVSQTAVAGKLPRGRSFLGFGDKDVQLSTVTEQQVASVASKEVTPVPDVITASTDGWRPAPGRPFVSLEFLDLSGNELVYLSPSALQLVEVLLERSAWRARNAYAGSGIASPAVLLLPNPHLLQPAAKALTGMTLPTLVTNTQAPKSPQWNPSSSLARDAFSSIRHLPPPIHNNTGTGGNDSLSFLLPPFVKRCCCCMKDLFIEGPRTYAHFTPMSLPSASVSVARQERQCETLGGVPVAFTNGADVLPEGLHVTQSAAGHITTDRRVLFGRRAAALEEEERVGGVARMSRAANFYALDRSMQMLQQEAQSSTTTGVCKIRVPTLFPLCSATECHIALHARLQTAGAAASEMPSAAVYPLE